MRTCQIVLLLLLGALLLVACATVEAPNQSESITLGIGTADGSCGTALCCSDCPAILVLRVIDGDTFTTSGDQSVRLCGVDTPERGQRCFSQATHWLRQLSSSTVRVEQGPRQWDAGGRLLFYAYTEAGNSIDEMLIREGMATAWTRDGQHRRLLLELEQLARRSGKGCLW